MPSSRLYLLKGAGAVVTRLPFGKGQGMLTACPPLVRPFEGQGVVTKYPLLALPFGKSQGVVTTSLSLSPSNKKGQVVIPACPSLALPFGND